MGYRVTVNDALRAARPVLSLALAPLFGVALLVPVAAPARADEVAVRPASASFTLTGRGYGHGRGMSQWGAYGAATAGLTWPQILAFYYPGTRRHDLGDSQIRVWISRDADGDTIVAPQAGLAATVGNTRRALPTGDAYRLWRAVASKGAVVVQYRDPTGAWRPTSLPPAPSVIFSTHSGTVQVVHRDASRQQLRGRVQGILDGSRMRTVLHSSMQSYLRGVVPAEVPSAWHVDALAAQSVAARTYAASYRSKQRATNATYDICDTVTCQVFNGVARYSAAGHRTAGEHPRTDAAIVATAGVVLRTGTAATAPFAHAEFSAANGGYTVAGGPFYQVAKPDPYDGRVANGANRWTQTVPVRTIERKYGIGTVTALRVLARDGRGDLGGRVRTLRVEGSTAGIPQAVEVSGTALRAALGLKSDWFTVAGSVTVPAGAPSPRPPSLPAPTVPVAPRPTLPTIPTKPPPAAMTPGAGPVRDITGDRRADVVYTDAAGRLLVRTAGAGGTLGAARVIGHGWRGFDLLIAAGQWDGAGGQDLLARQAATGRILLYPGNGRGGFGRAKVVGTGWRGYSSLTEVGDWDGDGRADLVGLHAATGDLVLVRGRAGGALSTPVVLAKGWNVGWVRGAGDVNRDGHPDLVSASRAGVLTVHEGTGAGRIARSRVLAGGWTAFADVWSPRDFGRRGADDLLALTRAGAVLRYPATAAGGYGRAVQVGSGVMARVVAR